MTSDTFDLETDYEKRRHQLGYSPVELTATQEEYKSSRYRRFGQSNPEPTQIPFWIDMVRSGKSAWQAQQYFNDRHESTDKHKVWSHNRVGCSLTELPDGRFIEIGGEHEDWYDDNFCIYNDVIMHGPNGLIKIWGYPESLFPPTDFHSATWVDGSIFIIGGLGYKKNRNYKNTVVYLLNCQTLSIRKLDCHGSGPTGIHGHTATHNPTDNCIVISQGKFFQRGNKCDTFIRNTSIFRLALDSLKWSKEALCQ